MTSVTSVGSVAERAMKKIRWRILPLIFLIYVVAFLDRANVAYAKLTMSADSARRSTAWAPAFSSSDTSFCRFHAL